MKETNKYNIKVTEILIGEECTSDFFMTERFCNRYAIICVKKSFYAIVDKNTKECIIRFKVIAPVQRGVYILHLEDDKHMLFCINRKEELVFSETSFAISAAFNNSSLAFTISPLS